MDSLFLNLLNISITAGWIVLAVIAIRLLFKKAPKYISCLLWIIVAIRLVCPFSFESVLSLIPSTQTIPDTVITDMQFNVDSGVPVIDNNINPYLSDHYFEGVTVPTNTGVYLLKFFGVVWLAGMIIMLAYMIFSFIKIRTQVSAKIRIDKNIFICDEVKAPFIMGIIRPEIYLPSDINEEQKAYVISHELAHLKRHDNLWKPLGFIILSVYWFNPLMWVAYILLCRDIESACDEKVIKNMSDEERAGYSQALLDCGTNKKSIKVCPVAFGETGVKQRVKSVLNYKKPAFWIIIIAVIALMPKVKEFVLENTTIYEATRQKVIHVFLNTIDDNEEGNNEAIKSLNMPDIITDLLIEKNTSEIYQALMVTLFKDYISQYFAMLIVNAALFVGMFIVLSIIKGILLKSSDVIAKIPIIKGINRLLGAAIGVIQSVIITWIGFFGVIMFLGDELGYKLLEGVNDSQFLTYLFNSNYLLRFIS